MKRIPMKRSLLLYFGGMITACVLFAGIWLIGWRAKVPIDQGSLGKLGKKLGDARLIRLIESGTLRVELEANGYVFFRTDRMNGIESVENRYPAYFDPFTGIPLRPGPPAGTVDKSAASVNPEPAKGR